MTPTKPIEHYLYMSEQEWNKLPENERNYMMCFSEVFARFSKTVTQKQGE